MVQRSTIKTALGIVLRVILLIGIIFGSAFILYPFHNLIVGSLSYKIPEGFFQTSTADWELSWLLTSTLIGGMIFGTLGKKIDYIFIAMFIALDIWEWTGTENITLQIWFVLVAVILAGNIIGFALKLLRQRFLPKVKV